MTAQLQQVAEAAEEIAASLRSRLAPDEVSLEFGLKVSGGVSWFFAKAQGEGAIPCGRKLLPTTTVSISGNGVCAAELGADGRYWRRFG